MNRLPKTVKATLILIILNAIFWFSYAVVSALGNVDSNTGILAVQWLMTGLAFICAAALGGIAFFLMRRSRFAYYFQSIHTGIDRCPFCDGPGRLAGHLLAVDQHYPFSFSAQGSGLVSPLTADS